MPTHTLEMEFDTAQGWITTEAVFDIIYDVYDGECYQVSAELHHFPFGGAKIDRNTAIAVLSQPEIERWETCAANDFAEDGYWRCNDVDEGYDERAGLRIAAE